MTTRLFLARHGETDWIREKRYQGQASVPLNERGIRQAHLLAVRLKGEDIEEMYTSDLARAYQTAKIVGQALGREPQPMAELREVDMGLWTGLTAEEVKDRFPEHLAEWRTDPLRMKRLQGESYLDLYQRVIVAMKNLIQAHPGEKILVVGHGGSIKCTILEALGIGPDHGLAVAEQLEADNGSLAILDYKGDKAHLVALNDTCHLRGL